MKKAINEKLYIEIFKDIIRNNDDYSNKEKVKKHNIAVTKLNKLTKEILEDKEYLCDMYNNLLNTEDERLKEWVSWECLNHKVLEDKAISILKDIANGNPKKKDLIEMLLKQKIHK